MWISDNKINKKEQLTVLWVKSQPSIFSYILSAIPNFYDAEDLLQRVAVISVQKYDQYDPHKSFVSWAIGIARNEILNYRKENFRKKMISIEAINSLSEVVIEEATTSMPGEIETALALCLSKVKSKWKKIVEFRYLREYKPNRIAQQLNMSENAVLIALFRIRKALRECIAHEIEKKRA